jgi:hypothetical protein
MFTNRKLPMRSVRLIQEYSTPFRQSEWKSSRTISTTPVYEETVDELTIDTFCISILVIIINVLICVSLFYLLSVVLSSSMCIYNSN